jgi:hypothetical protein
LRDRFAVAYRGWKPFVPAASLEMFHDLEDGLVFDKLWLTLGAGYGRRREIETFYRCEQSQRAGEPTLHILGLAFHSDV